MNHLNEAELALHYYGDADDPAAVERHLAECGECRREMEQLRATLGMVTLPVPERAERYEADVWHNVRAHLPEAPRRSWWSVAPRQWAVGGALATLVIAAFLMGRWWERGGVASHPAVTQASGEKVRERVLLVAVGDHLDRSQMVLIELANTRPGRTVDISAQQEAAQRLLDDNRLYRQTAAQVQDRAVADVLDQLEPLLVDLVHQPSTVSAAEFEDIRSRIEDKGILFKVRVLSSNVRERERQSNTAAPVAAQKVKT
jgi:anti-sigma factor RsiW